MLATSIRPVNRLVAAPLNFTALPDREGVRDGETDLLPVDVPESERVPDEDAVCVTLRVAVLDKEEPCDRVPVPVIV